jgi:hypothetical protein
MKSYKYKVKYLVDNDILPLDLTVFFTFVPGAPATRWQPADPDEVEIFDVECQHLSAPGSAAMIEALNESQQFYDWLLNHKERAEMLP